MLGKKQLNKTILKNVKVFKIYLDKKSFMIILLKSILVKNEELEFLNV